MSLVQRAAQAALAVPFILLGYDSASNPGARVAAAEKLGLPNPEAAVRCNGAAMVTGGLALALGIFPRAAAFGLAASLVPTTIAGHPFWETDDPQARAGQRIQALKNLGLIGGLLAVAARRRK